MPVLVGGFENREHRHMQVGATVSVLRNGAGGAARLSTVTEYRDRGTHYEGASSWAGEGETNQASGCRWVVGIGTNALLCDSKLRQLEPLFWMDA